MNRVLEASLLGGPLSWVIAVVGTGGGVFLLVARQLRWWTRVVPVVLAGSAATALTAALLIDRVWRPFPDRLPVIAVVAAGVVLAAAVLAAVGARQQRWVGRAASVVALLAVLAAAAQSINGYYRQYPTLRAALGLPAANEVLFTSVAPRAPLAAGHDTRPLDVAWRAPAGMPNTGVVTQLSIPGPVSGFIARPAMLYLPPAYLSSPRAQLPVLVLLAGQPGSPQDWFNGGRLSALMDAYAAAHNGLAPVVVVPDHLGSPLANPLCLDSRLGNAATYLTADVPAWIRSTFQVVNDPRGWAVGGFSSGGTCALQLAVTAPEVYPTFLDISGQSEPTLGDRTRTVQAAFGGDTAAFAAVNPLDVLATRSFPVSAGFLVGGAADTTYLPQAQRVYAATRAAGMDVRLDVLPGGHTWQVWGRGLEQALPWLGARLRLTS